MDDLTIKENVETELQYEPLLNAAAIGVAVKDGIVTLTGHVTIYTQKWSRHAPASGPPGLHLE